MHARRPTRKMVVSENGSTTGRFRIVALGFVLGAVVVMGRLFYWQILRADKLVRAASRQHWSQETIDPPRGQIMASDMTILAGSQSGYSVFLDRKQAPKVDNRELVEKLSPLTMQNMLPAELAWKLVEASEEVNILEKPQEITPPPPPAIEVEKERLGEILVNNPSSWIELSPYINQSRKEEIENLKIEGLVFIPKNTRIYPEESQFPHVLGFVGQTSTGMPQGYFGLEGFYDRELSGQKGILSQETDARGNRIAIGDSKTIKSIQGRSLVTNLDRTVQYIIEKELAKGLQDYIAVGGTVTVINPKTGAVLGMAALPQYQPQWYKDFPEEAYANPIVAESYEPGSIFKPLVMAVGVDKGAVNKDTICPCRGPVTIGPNTISNWDNNYHPNSSLTDILRNSDNIGMVFVGQQMGEQNLIEALNKFGIGSKTGVDLQEEMSPKLRDSWLPIDLATATFGQGIAVTPLQVTSAMSAIANDGILMQPQVVKQIEDGNKIIKIEPQPVRQVISKETADEMKQIMTTAFGFFIQTFNRKDLEGYRIAGKSGTAQIPIQGHYDKDKVMASFIGFAPSDDPQFVMLVTLKEPKNGNFASQTAAPLWFTIAKQLFPYFGIQSKK